MFFKERAALEFAGFHHFVRPTPEEEHWAVLFRFFEARRGATGSRMVSLGPVKFPKSKDVDVFPKQVVGYCDIVRKVFYLSERAYEIRMAW